jgi:hypothetical protein
MNVKEITNGRLNEIAHRAVCGFGRHIPWLSCDEQVALTQSELDRREAAKQPPVEAVDSGRKLTRKDLRDSARLALLGSGVELPPEKPASETPVLRNWMCPVCSHCMTEQESKNYAGCPTGMHAVRHVNLSAKPEPVEPIINPDFDGKNWRDCIRQIQCRQDVLEAEVREIRKERAG